MISSLFELLFVGFIVVAVAFWWYTNELKQFAYRVARRRCDEDGVQFLDDSVMLSRVRLQRNETGGMVLQCRYSFEFATVGDTRYHGDLIFLGRTLMHVEMEPHRF